MRVLRKVSLLIIIILTIVIIDMTSDFITPRPGRLIQAQSNTATPYPAPATSTSLYPGPTTGTNLQISATSTSVTVTPLQTTPTFAQITSTFTPTSGCLTTTPGATYAMTSTITATVTLAPFPTITLIFPENANLLNAKQPPGEAALVKQTPGSSLSGISRLLPFMVLVGVWGILGVLLLFSLWRLE